jgi:hypothetical protein
MMKVRRKSSRRSSTAVSRSPTAVSDIAGEQKPQRGQECDSDKISNEANDRLLQALTFSHQPSQLLGGAARRSSAMKSCKEQDRKTSSVEQFGEQQQERVSWMEHGGQQQYAQELDSMRICDATVNTPPASTLQLGEQKLTSLEICDETLLTPPQVELDAKCPDVVPDKQRNVGGSLKPKHRTAVSCPKLPQPMRIAADTVFGDDDSASEECTPDSDYTPESSPEYTPDSAKQENEEWQSPTAASDVADEQEDDAKGCSSASQQEPSECITVSHASSVCDMCSLGLNCWGYEGGRPDQPLLGSCAKASIAADNASACSRA